MAGKATVINKDFVKWATGLKEASGAFGKRLVRVGEEVGELAIMHLERTTDTWDHPVEFRFKVRHSGTSMVVEVGTEDPIWNWVNEGTSGPYPIEPTGPWPLRFRAGYSPKTRPLQLASFHSRSFGPTVRAWGVMHPGIRARKFTEVMLRQIEPELIMEMQQDIRNWASKYF